MDLHNEAEPEMIAHSGTRGMIKVLSSGMAVVDDLLYDSQYPSFGSYACSTA